MKRSLLFVLMICLSCFAYSQSIADASDGLSSFNNEVKVSIYPNPASDYINVQDKNESLGSVIIYNLAGRKIKSFTVDGSSLLNIMELPKGMYLIQFLDKRDKLLTTQRLSKK